MEAENSGKKREPKPFLLTKRLKMRLIRYLPIYEPETATKAPA